MDSFRTLVEGFNDTPSISGPDARYWNQWTDQDDLWLRTELETLGWKQIQDLYDPNELEICQSCPADDCTCCPDCDDECHCGYEATYKTPVTEALSYQGRVKKRLAAMKSKNRRASARRLSLKRASGPAALKKRAILAAQRLTKKRLGSKSVTGSTDRRRVEKQVSASVVAHVAQRLQPHMRTLEQKRLSKAKK
jgi:hypothetical protein